QIESEYSSLFSIGFTLEGFLSIDPDRDHADSLLIPCRNVSDRMQFRATHYRDLRQACNSLGINPLLVQKLITLQSSSLLPRENAQALLRPLVPSYDLLQQKWDAISELRLTPAGLAIANANLKVSISRSFDLSTWIH